MQVDTRVPGWNFRKLHDRYILGFALVFFLAVILTGLRPNWLTYIFLLISGSVFGLVLYFFRDPARVLRRETHLYYSPADGKVSDITPVTLPSLPGSEFIRIGIFMSVLDVHVQRFPVSGEVDFVSHQPGSFHPAYDPAAAVENDQIIMGLNTDQGLILVKQIAGILARKCVNYARPGDQVQVGQRYGLIKFGSRVEVYLPVDVEIVVSIGDKMIAGITPLAEKGHD
jgi:phosphatidylserine decarboxylase